MSSALVNLRIALGVAKRLAPRIASGPAQARVWTAAVALGSGRWRRPVHLLVDTPSGTARFTVPDLTAFRVLGEVFTDGEYDFDSVEPPTRILDLGANIGASVLFFRRKYPEASIVAVEASPVLAPLLRQNVASLNVRVIAAAVAVTTGTVTFYSTTSSWAGSTTKSSWAGSHGGGEEITVPALALDELLDDGVDLLKIDVEGAEFDVLPASQNLSKVRVVVGEIHAPPSSEECQRVLGAFTDFEVTVNSPEADDSFTIFRAELRSRPSSSRGSSAIEGSPLGQRSEAHGHEGALGPRTAEQPGEV